MRSVCRPLSKKTRFVFTPAPAELKPPPGMPTIQYTATLLEELLLRLHKGFRVDAEAG